MNRLTDVEMLQAHFARRVDMDPDINHLPEDERAQTAAPPRAKAAAEGACLDCFA